MSEQEQTNSSVGKAVEGQGGGADGARGTALVMMEQTSPKPYHTLRDSTASAPELQRPNYKRTRGMPVHSVAEEIKHALDETIPENQGTDKSKHSDRENTSREHKKISPASKKRDVSDEITLAPIENTAPQTLNKQPIPENMKSLAAAASSNSASAAAKLNDTDDVIPTTSSPEVARKQSESENDETDSTINIKAQNSIDVHPDSHHTHLSGATITSKDKDDIDSVRNIEENSINANRISSSSESTIKFSKEQDEISSSLVLEKRTSLDWTSSYIKPSGTELTLSKGRYETDPALIVEEQNSGDACDERTASDNHLTTLSQNEGYDDCPEQQTHPVIPSENTEENSDEVSTDAIQPERSINSKEINKNDGIINEGPNRKVKPHGISMTISKKSLSNDNEENRKSKHSGISLSLPTKSLRKKTCKNTSAQSGGSRGGSTFLKTESESENDMNSDDEGKAVGAAKRNILSIIKDKIVVLGNKLRDSLDF